MRMQYKTALMTFAAGILGCVATHGVAADEVSSYAPVTQQRLENPEAGNWLLYRRTYDGHGFSPLVRSTPTTSESLMPVWTYPPERGGRARGAADGEQRHDVRHHARSRCSRSMLRPAT